MSCLPRVVLTRCEHPESLLLGLPTGHELLAPCGVDPVAPIAADSCHGERSGFCGAEPHPILLVGAGDRQRRSCRIKEVDELDRRRIIPLQIVRQHAPGHGIAAVLLDDP